MFVKLHLRIRSCWLHAIDEYVSSYLTTVVLFNFELISILYIHFLESRLISGLSLANAYDVKRRDCVGE